MKQNEKSFLNMVKYSVFLKKVSSKLINYLFIYSADMCQSHKDTRVKTIHRDTKGGSLVSMRKLSEKIILSHVDFSL